MAAARFAKKKGASVTVTDIAEEKTLGSNWLQVQKMGVKLELGRHNIETFEHADLIVVSPGVPHTILPIERAKEKGIPVLGELELASRYHPGTCYRHIRHQRENHNNTAFGQYARKLRV